MFWGLVPFVGPVEANQALSEIAAADETCGRSAALRGRAAAG
jgi:hypothetical protein